jgi:hypothetical protein
MFVIELIRPPVDRDEHSRERQRRTGEISLTASG